MHVGAELVLVAGDGEEVRVRVLAREREEDGAERRLRVRREGDVRIADEEEVGLVLEGASAMAIIVVDDSSVVVAARRR